MADETIETLRQHAARLTADDRAALKPTPEEGALYAEGWGASGRPLHPADCAHDSTPDVPVPHMPAEPTPAPVATPDPRDAEIDAAGSGR
jgi:hypothetical protein